MAMLARGFEGKFWAVKNQFHFDRNDFLFMGLWLSFFLLARIHNLPLLLGDLMTGNAL
jgi:energy-coupling factor transporter transmembrane protein EcfT